MGTHIDDTTHAVEQAEEYLHGEHSHYLGDYDHSSKVVSSMTVPDTTVKKRGRPRKSVVVDKSNKSVEGNLTDTIGASFSGS